MILDSAHNDTVGRVANKVRVEGALTYRSSDALLAPEIFLRLMTYFLFSTNFYMVLYKIF